MTSTTHLWNVLSMNTVYGIPHILPRGHDQTERNQHHDGYRIMETKNRRIDVDVTDFNQVL